MTKGQADAAIIRRHLAALREALSNLQRHTGCTANELRASADLRWTIERGLQLCVQNVLDIATHLVASCGLDAPDYATAIDKLAEIGALPADFAGDLRSLAGFRNVLVQGYLQIDLSIVERVLNKKLVDLELFAAHVDAYLARSKQE